MRRFLTLILCTSWLFASAQVPDYVPTDSLVAWYLFSGNFQDESGNEHHATPVADVVLTDDRFGQPNAAFYVDGDNDHVQTPLIFNSAWIERSPFGSNWTIHLDRHRPLSTRIHIKSKVTAGTCISFLIHWMHLATVLEQAVGTSCVVTRPNIIWGMRT